MIGAPCFTLQSEQIKFHRHVGIRFISMGSNNSKSENFAFKN